MQLAGAAAAPLIVDTADIALPMLQKMLESRVTHHRGGNATRHYSPQAYR